MKYIIEARNIWELGKRANQEDSIYPQLGAITESDRTFVVCDGMGGHDAGEVASQTVCQTLFETCQNMYDQFAEADFKEALAKAYDALDEKDTGAEKKMGTTMTFLKLHSEGCFIAHIGDSRVYHIRPGKDGVNTRILFQTRDHSLVNDLIKIGELTPEEAKHSKQKNVITRAMQPNMERRPKADIYESSDIKPGDYFLLCTDGVLEQMEDENVKFIFSETVDDIDKKVKMLIDVTADNKDNHSAILVRICDVKQTKDSTIQSPKTNCSEGAEDTNLDDGQQKNKGQEKKDELLPQKDNSVTKKTIGAIPPTYRKLKILFFLIILILLVVGGCYAYKKWQQEKSEPPTRIEMSFHLS